MLVAYGLGVIPIKFLPFILCRKPIPHRSLEIRRCKSEYPARFENTPNFMEEAWFVHKGKMFDKRISTDLIYRRVVVRKVEDIVVVDQ